MNARELEIKGAWLIEGRRFGDERGFFQEWFKSSDITKETDVQFAPVQANISKSAAGVVRGIHYSIAAAGQGKLVTVMSGAIDDYIIDVRPTSPTFGEWRRVRLTSDEGNALLIDPHLGHAFQALNGDTVVSYLVTAEFDPAMEKGITPFCPRVGITWDSSLSPVVSPKDMQAPGLLDQLANGNLP